MRLLVRATTIRAPTGPSIPRIFGFGQDRDDGYATATVDLVLSASGNDNDRGYAVISGALQHLPAYGSTESFGYAVWDNPSTETAIGYDRDRGQGTYLPNRGINYGRDNDTGRGTYLPNRGVNYGRDSDRGTAQHRLLNPGTDRDRGYASARFGARGTDGDRGSAVPTPAVDYAYSRTLVVERQNDLTAGTIANHVLRFSLTDTWLKQSNLTGGRIRSVNAYDLIFETLASARLDHEIEAYDGTAGVAYFAVRVPSWAFAVDPPFRFRVRYGATL